MPDSAWLRHFLYRRETLKATWKLRLLIVLLPVLVVWMTRSFWTQRIGQSLMCEERTPHSDALLIENFDPEYLVFERAAALQKSGVAARIFIPVRAALDSKDPDMVALGVAEVMARVAQLGRFELIPIEETEPITLNAGYQLRDLLIREQIRSIVIVAPAFRSQRSLMVYSQVLAPAGIAVGCAPAFGRTNAGNWTQTLHGMQDVVLQFVKLQYYRFYVFPSGAFVNPEAERSSQSGRIPAGND